MKITWLEIKKIIRSPVISVFFIIMLCWNAFLIFDSSAHKSELKIIQSIVATYGQTFDDRTLTKMESDLLQQIQALNFPTIEAFYTELTIEHYEKSSDQEKYHIDQIYLMLAYLQHAKQLDERYEAIDLEKSKQRFFAAQDLPNWLVPYFEDQFDAWQARLTEIIETNEHKQWFFLGSYNQHSTLYKSIFVALAIEGFLLATIITAFIINYEFEYRTQHIMYATKRGRRLLTNKIASSFAVSALFIGALFMFTFLLFFNVYDYSSIWLVDVASGFNWENILPYITWWELPYWLYFITAIIILLISCFIVVGLTIIFSIVLKNSYRTVAVTITFLLAMATVTLFETPTWMNWLLHYNLVILVLNPNHFLNGGEYFFMQKYFEVITLTGWSVIVIVGMCLTTRYHQMKDVK